MTPNQLPLHPSTFVKQLTLIFIAILTGLAMFAGVAVFLNQTQPLANAELNHVFSIIVPVMSLASAAGGYYILPYLLSRTPETKYLQSKLITYRSVTIIRLAIWDGGGFICLVSYLLTGNNLYFAYLFPIVALFVLFAPNRERIIGDLKLSSSEAKELG